jgi:hypothetical protein
MVFTTHKDTATSDAMAAATKASGIPITLVRSESFMVFNSFPWKIRLRALMKSEQYLNNRLKNKRSQKKSVTLLLYLPESKRELGEFPGGEAA